MKLSLDGRDYKITLDTAVRMTLCSEYQWVGSNDRVRRMTPIRKQARWYKCWRTTGACVLEPGLEWAR